jgi:hypothetical protein
MLEHGCEEAGRKGEWDGDWRLFTALGRAAGGKRGRQGGPGFGRGSGDLWRAREGGGSYSDRRGTARAAQQRPAAARSWHTLFQAGAGGAGSLTRGTQLAAGEGGGLSTC